MGATRVAACGCEKRRISIHAPAWGATGNAGEYDIQQFISIHAPRMGSDCHVPRHISTRLISIHAPRMGSDRQRRRIRHTTIHFNPRPPHGERLSRTAPHKHKTYFNPRSPHGERPDSPETDSPTFRISIHAPRMGSDYPGASTDYLVPHFNPRSPHGERHFRHLIIACPSSFQSTLPAWGATVISLLS